MPECGGAVEDRKVSLANRVRALTHALVVPRFRLLLPVAARWRLFDQHVSRVRVQTRCRGIRLLPVVVISVDVFGEDQVYVRRLARRAWDPARMVAEGLCMITA